MATDRSFDADLALRAGEVLEGLQQDGYPNTEILSILSVCLAFKLAELAKSPADADKGLKTAGVVLSELVTSMYKERNKS